LTLFASVTADTLAIIRSLTVDPNKFQSQPHQFSETLKFILSSHRC